VRRTLAPFVVAVCNGSSTSTPAVGVRSIGVRTEALGFDHEARACASGAQALVGRAPSTKCFKDFEEGLAITNSNRFANGSRIDTTSRRHAREFTRDAEGGMAGVNVGNPAPFPNRGHRRAVARRTPATGPKA
jgi:hypothetical protein